MNQELTLSIVLPVFNDQANLDRILTELADNDKQDNWEVIIVDDGSVKPLTLGNRSPAKSKILRNDHNQGVAAARNRGVNEARGKHLVFLSVFLSIPQNYLGHLTKFISETAFDFAQHLIVTGQTENATHFQRFISAHADRINASSGNLSITNCQFAAAVITRKTILAVDGFDESMQHYGGHELDLIYRLDQAGYKQRILINALALQRVKLEDHKSIQKRLREYGGVGLPNLLNKHPELTPRILKKPSLWFLLSRVGMPRWLETRLGRLIESNKPLRLFTYRLYLHLLMRNAWDAR